MILTFIPMVAFHPVYHDLRVRLTPANRKNQSNTLFVLGLVLVYKLLSNPFFQAVHLLQMMAVMHLDEHVPFLRI